MADITSVLEIDIRDDAFKQMRADLEAFAKSMQSMGMGSGKGLVPVRNVGREYLEQEKALKKANDSIFKFTNSLTRLSVNIAVDSGKKLISAFASITKAILGTGGLLAGITSIASITGMIAGASMTNRRLYQAQGLGFSSAMNLPRLKTTLGQVLDVEGVAGQLQSEMAQPGSLLLSGMGQMMGISPSQLKNLSKDELMFAFTRYAAKQGSAPGGMMPAQMGAAGLGFLGTEGLTRIVANADRISELEKDNAMLRKQTELRNQSGWQKFNQFFTGGFLGGQTQMMNILEPLLDPLMSLGKTIQAKTEGDLGLGGAIDYLKEKIVAFNQGLGNVHNWKDFWGLMKSSMMDLWKDIKPLFEELGNWMKRMLQEAFAPVIDAGMKFSRMLDQIASGPMSALLGIDPATNYGGRINRSITGSGSEGLALQKGAAYADLFEKYGGQAGVDPAILFGIGMQESRFNPLAKSRAGARGLMQFMPGTASRFGIDPMDPDQSIRGASEYLRRLRGMFGGDNQAALAAYNWGEGNVQKAMNRYGSDWFSHAPEETRNYVPSVMRYAQMASRNLQVSVSAPAGSDVTVNTTRAVGAASGP